MKKIKYFLVLFPLLLGVIIYILYRSKNLYYYNIIHFLDINGYVIFARKIAFLYRRLLPNWVIYSLPDGLWLFSTGAILLLNRRRYFFHFIWYSIIYLAMIIIEFIQKFYGGHGTTIGTYDKSDVLAFSWAYISIVILSLIIRRFDNKYNYLKSFRLELFQNLLYTIIFLLLGILPSMF